MAFQVAVKTGTASGSQGKNTHGQKEYLQNREGGWNGFLPSFYFPIVLFNFFITLYLGNILQTPRFSSYSDGCLSKVVSAIHSFNDCAWQVIGSSGKKGRPSSRLHRTYTWTGVMQSSVSNSVGGDPRKKIRVHGSVNRIFTCWYQSPPKSLGLEKSAEHTRYKVLPVETAQPGWGGQINT